MANLNKQDQSGRSMVEMLGVLAVIGVLSVAGIAGYTTAMTKYKANEILNGASVRAMHISSQIQAGSSNPTLTEFGSETVSGVGYTANYTSGATTFSLTLSSVEPEVCTQMKNNVGSNANVNIGDCPSAKGNLTLTYNTDLSAPVSTTPAAKPGHECNDSDDCPSGATCENGYCQCASGSIYTGGNCVAINNTCKDDNDCPSNSCCGDNGKCVIGHWPTTEEECKDWHDPFCWDERFVCNSSEMAAIACTSNSDCIEANTYCYIESSNGGNGDCQQPDSGSCKTIGTSIEITSDQLDSLKVAGFSKDIKVSTNTMTWWAARNWCAAQGLSLIDISGTKLGCYNTSGPISFGWGSSGAFCCSENNSCYDNNFSKSSQQIQALHAAFPDRHLFTSTYSSSCEIFEIYGNAVDKIDLSYYVAHALCE